MSHAARSSYRGPALFSYGFRPFFLLAIGFAVLAIPIWIAAYFDGLALAGPFASVDWHIHEMLFGYVAAVLSGFLFTAIPNWTGRMPIRGWPLVFLTILWSAGRLAVAGVGKFGALAIMAIDCAFLAAICAVITVEIVAARNWRNLKVVFPVLLLLGANILFHVEVLREGTTIYASRFGLSVVVFLITLIGGRIIPSFTRNWLAKENQGALPVPFGKFDGVCLLAGAGALILWVVLPNTTLSRLALVSAAVLHGLRLWRWRGYRTLGSPLLFVLHLAYAFVPLGFLALGAGEPTAGIHLLGIGAVGGMTLSVMARATLGHTGRPLALGSWSTAAIGLVFIAGVVRSTAAFTGEGGIIIAAGLWALGFGMMLARVGPWLWSERAE